MTEERIQNIHTFLQSGKNLLWNRNSSEWDAFYSKMIEAVYVKTGITNFSENYIYGNNKLAGFHTDIHLPRNDGAIFASAYRCPMLDDDFFQTYHYTWSVETFFFASELYLSQVEPEDRRELLCALICYYYGEVNADLDDSILVCAQFLDDYIKGADISSYADTSISFSLSVKSYMTTILHQIWLDVGAPPKELFKKMLPELLSFFFHMDLDEEHNDMKGAYCLVLSGTFADLDLHHACLCGSKKRFELLKEALNVIKNPILTDTMSMYSENGFQTAIFYCSSFHETDIHPLYYLAEYIISNISTLKI